jgi:hypothetical protein
LIIVECLNNGALDFLGQLLQQHIERASAEVLTANGRAAAARTELRRLRERREAAEAAARAAGLSIAADAAALQRAEGLPEAARRQADLLSVALGALREQEAAMDADDREHDARQ